MDMGQRLGRIRVAVETLSLRNPPFTGKRFYVPVPYGVFYFLFHDPVNINGLLQALQITGCPEMFRQAINGIRACAGLFVRFQQRAICLNRPIHTSIPRVDEMIDEIPLGTVCQRPISLIAIQAVSRGKSPQDAGIQHTAFRSIRYRSTIPSHRAIKTARWVNAIFLPERKNIVF